MFEAILVGLLIVAAYFYKNAFFKFAVIALVVLIICYVIVISTKLEEKYWPPVFMGGILVVGGLYILESKLNPPPKPRTWGDWFSGMVPSFSYDTDEYVVPEVAEPKPWNPFNEEPSSNNPFYGTGGKRRRPKRSK
uniref:Uncharacterized protein n=1 Tax=viral metagenome TaxID=1070528 RepID=A0A6C0F6U9_9ZZZZ